MRSRQVIFPACQNKLALLNSNLIQEEAFKQEEFQSWRMKVALMLFMTSSTKSPDKKKSSWGKRRIRHWRSSRSNKNFIVQLLVLDRRGSNCLITDWLNIASHRRKKLWTVSNSTRNTMICLLISRLNLLWMCKWKMLLKINLLIHAIPIVNLKIRKGEGRSWLWPIKRILWMMMIPRKSLKETAAVTVYYPNIV